VAVMLSQHLRDCRNSPPLWPQIPGDSAPSLLESILTPDPR